MQGVKSESARGSYPPEMGGIFKSDSGFATSDLSTGKRLFSVKLVRRAKPLEKTPSVPALAVPQLAVSRFCFSNTKKKPVGRGAQFSGQMVAQRDCA